MRRTISWAAFLCSTAIATAVAQNAPSPPRTPAAGGSSTGPTLVVSGCLRDASGSSTGRTGSSSAMAQARYSLDRVQYGSSGAAFDEWMRARALSSTMARTGSSGNGGTRDGRPTELHLGTESQKEIDLSRYVEQEIEVTGTLGPIPGVSKQAGAGSRTNDRSASNDASSSSSPRLTVTAVKVLSDKCSR